MAGSPFVHALWRVNKRASAGIAAIILEEIADDFRAVGPSMKVGDLHGY